MAVNQEHNERTRIERVDPLLGEVFDRRFRIDARIAAGGFGAIYRATHIKSGHELALKVLHANLTDDPGVVARFRREGTALTRLRDPHTITAYELGEAPDGQLYIVMELLRGESLYERFRARGALPWQRVIAIARDVCSSLIEAHALGIIHRDLKPTNIHLEPHPHHDFVKVLDFGIAKILQDSDIDSSELTHAGQMIGTLDYMSPEQMVGGICGPASDIYTLGIVMYEMIAGRKPFDDANSAAAALAAVLTTTPARLSVAAVVPAEIDLIVMKCIERHHADRYQSAADLAADLDEILTSGEDAVTTVDLAHPRGLMTTLKGMRMPTKPPATAAPDADLLDLVSTGVRAPAVPAPPRPRLTPIPTLTSLPPPATTAPAAQAVAPPRVTPAAPAAPSPRLTPVPQAPAAATAAAPERADPLPKLIPDDPDDPAAHVAPSPRLTPISAAAPIHPDTTLVGQLMTPRTPAPRAPAPRSAAPRSAAPHPAAPRPAAPRPRPSGTPQAGTPIPVKNLREAYPNIHRPVPSPMRPQPTPFDDRPASSVDFGSAFDMSHVVRRDAFMRRVALVVGVAVALLVVFLIARRW